jgi:hypothetical protein
MQDELDADYADLGIRLLAVNGSAYSSGNDEASVGREIPLLQDTVSDDVWGAWDVTWRDVVIVDPIGRKVGAVNLTGNSLSDPVNYAFLLDKLVAESLKRRPGEVDPAGME